MKEQLALGIDIGGTNTAYGLVNRLGEIVRKGTFATAGHATASDYVSALKAELTPLIEREGRQYITGAGIGAPSANYFTGEIVYAPNMPWPGIVPIGQMISEALALNTKVTNDANAAAIGEMTYGAAKGMNDFILVTLGTGVGSGFVANGQLIHGHTGFAGELGHVIAVRDGRPCGCGRRGCLETYASATGIVRTAEEWLEHTDKETTLRSQKGKITAKLIHDAAMKGDTFALDLFAFTGKILGRTLADTVAITAPEAIIFFGGLAKSGRMLFDHVRSHMEDNLLHLYKNKVSFLQSALPDADAAILGASALAW